MQEETGTWRQAEDSWCQDCPFGLSIGRGKNSLVAGPSASLIFNINTYISDSGFLILIPIRIHATVAPS